MILTPVDSMLHWLTMIGVGEYCNDCNILYYCNGKISGPSI